MTAVIQQSDACYKTAHKSQWHEGQNNEIEGFRGGFQNKGPSGSTLKDKLETSSWKWDKP